MERPVVVFDLDDTLFPEMDYVRSAYREIARRFGRQYLPAMLAADSPRAAFDSTGLPVGELLDIYRTHFPDISLPWQSLYTLAALTCGGFPLALVTDGRSLTQRHKIEALRLDRFISDDLVFISEEVGSDKLSGESFRRIMSVFGNSRSYFYVGDNPEKDFVRGNELGWTTVCQLGGADGHGLFCQDFMKFPEGNRPEIIIRQLTELLKIVNL